MLIHQRIRSPSGGYVRAAKDERRSQRVLEEVGFAQQSVLAHGQAVVGGMNHDGVVQQSALFEGSVNVADPFVHIGNHSVIFRLRSTQVAGVSWIAQQAFVAGGFEPVLLRQSCADVRQFKYRRGRIASPPGVGRCAWIVRRGKRHVAEKGRIVGATRFQNRMAARAKTSVEKPPAVRALSRG